VLPKHQALVIRHLSRSRQPRARQRGRPATVGVLQAEQEAALQGDIDAARGLGADERERPAVNELRWETPQPDGQREPEALGECLKMSNPNRRFIAAPE
jgi:hypothetical protein